MIFLILPSSPPQIAACEDERHAARYLARGYVVVDAAQFSAAWSERDTATRLAQARQDEQEREWAQLRRIVGRTPGKVYPTRETGV